MNASMRPGEANILSRRSSLPPLTDSRRRDSIPPVATDASDTKRVLFVSDRSTSFDSAQRKIAENLLAWDAEFALGAYAALGQLAQHRFDAIVVDSDMSGIAGVDLLRRVRTEYPTVARILVADGGERELRCAQAIRYDDFQLPTEYGALDLCVAVERACVLRARLGRDAVRSLVEELPAALITPTTFIALAGAFANSRSTLGDAARIVESDALLSAKVLRLANSVQLGSTRRIGSVEQAVLHVGLDVVQGLALTVPIFGNAEPPSIDGFSPDRIMKHSVLTGRIARQLLSDPVLSAEACLAAFVHDIGKLALARTMPCRVREIRRKALGSLRPVHEIERTVLGATSAEIGASIVDRWGLPFFVAESVACHRHPGAVWDGPCDVLAALHVADAIVDATVNCGIGCEPEPAFDFAFLHRTGFGAELPRWRAIAMREFGHSLQRPRPT